MSDFTWKTGNGGLFINRGKGPKMKGEINIDGKVVKLAAWAKETKNGDEWLSLTVDTFVPKSQSTYTEKGAAAWKAEDAKLNREISGPAGKEFDDSDLPF